MVWYFHLFQNLPQFIVIHTVKGFGTVNKADRNLECWSMNQGKLEVVKQEMARVNVNILGISELQWTGMGEFNSDDHYTYCLPKPLLKKLCSI